MNLPSPIGATIRGLVESIETRHSERQPIAPERVGVERQPLPRLLRQAVLRRDDYTCLWCSRSAARRALLEIDHIVPWSAGGADHPVNLRTLCQRCNQQRGNRATGRERRAPVIVRACPSCMTYDLANYVEVGVIEHAYCMGCHYWVQAYDAPGLMFGGPIPADGIPVDPDPAPSRMASPTNPLRRRRPLDWQTRRWIEAELDAARRTQPHVKTGDAIVDTAREDPTSA